MLGAHFVARRALSLGARSRSACARSARTRPVCAVVRRALSLGVCSLGAHSLLLGVHYRSACTVARRALSLGARTHPARTLVTVFDSVTRLVCSMLDRLCLSVSDILRVTLVACAQRTSRGSFAFACVAAHRPRQFNVWIVEKTKQILGPRTSSALRSGHGRSPRRSMGGPPDRGNIIGTGVFACIPRRVAARGRVERPVLYSVWRHLYPTAQTDSTIGSVSSVRAYDMVVNAHHRRLVTSLE